MYRYAVGVADSGCGKWSVLGIRRATCREGGVSCFCPLHGAAACCQSIITLYLESLFASLFFGTLFVRSTSDSIPVRLSLARTRPRSPDSCGALLGRRVQSICNLSPFLTLSYPSHAALLIPKLGKWHAGGTRPCCNSWRTCLVRLTAVVAMLQHVAQPGFNGGGKRHIDLTARVDDPSSAGWEE